MHIYILQFKLHIYNILFLQYLKPVILNNKYIIPLLIFFTTLVKGQDVITLKTGEQIKCKVVEVDTDKVKYKKYGVNDSTVYFIRKSDEVRINFSSAAEIVSPAINKGGPMSKEDSVNYYKKGRDDAEKYYASFTTPGATGTFWVSFLFGGIGGLIPAVACASNPPKDKNIHLPKTAILYNQEYMSGYRFEAYRIKKRRVWLNFAIGVLLAGTLVAIASSAK